MVRNTVRGDTNRGGAVEAGWYRYNEVYLENGRYLDGYDPIGKKIVSRKAIDLENIDPYMFEKYCQEFGIKYAVGTKIKTLKSGYEDIKETLLNGKYKLEIPISNKTFEGLKQFEEIAKRYDVEIIFKLE